METIGDTLGFHKSSVSRSVRDVSQALVNISSQFIKWPSPNEKVIIKKGFYSIAGFPAVVGAVDGTHVRIIAPSDHEPAAYVNRKGYHSTNTQAICNHEGKFTNIVAKWPGSNHDSFIFRESNIGAYLEAHHRDLDIDGVLLGDSGYACSRYLVTPFLRPTSEAQMRYNNSHAQTRTVIERSFGWLKRRFLALHGEIKCKPERAAKIIVACAVLHNIAQDRRETINDAGCDDTQDQRDEADVLDEVAAQPMNNNIRQFIVNNYF
ncbi:putative nuclease HARBI1 [Saccostrea cucullata]|uniref:putative nuclease HARBI1 n=1 Tax=Saccostrea cuccullata TaxID=36930 RepID=UPI002ECFC8E5